MNCPSTFLTLVNAGFLVVWLVAVGLVFRTWRKLSRLEKEADSELRQLRAIKRAALSFPYRGRDPVATMGPDKQPYH